MDGGDDAVMADVACNSVCGSEGDRDDGAALLMEFDRDR